MWRAFLIGVLIWIVGTIIIRLCGELFLRPNQISRSLALYIISFIAMILLVRGICRWLALETPRVMAVSFLILPTLLLDPFSCVFFASIFPNIDPAAAGLFGGWMLICCGGAVLGGLFK